jgi:hypothetical protein
MTLQVCGTVTAIQLESSKSGSAQPLACPSTSGSIAKRHSPERESEDDGMATRGPVVGLNAGVGDEVMGCIDPGLKRVPQPYILTSRMRKIARI